MCACTIIRISEHIHLKDTIQRTPQRPPLEVVYEALTTELTLTFDIGTLMMQFQFSKSSQKVTHIVHTSRGGPNPHPL